MTRQELIPIVNNAIKDYERVIIMIKGQNLKVCFYILTKNNMLFGLCRYFSCTLGDYWVPLLINFARSLFILSGVDILAKQNLMKS